LDRRNRTLPSSGAEGSTVSIAHQNRDSVGKTQSLAQPQRPGCSVAIDRVGFDHLRPRPDSLAHPMKRITRSGRGTNLMVGRPSALTIFGAASVPRPARRGFNPSLSNASPNREQQVHGWQTGAPPPQPKAGWLAATCPTDHRNPGFSRARRRKIFEGQIGARAECLPHRPHCRQTLILLVISDDKKLRDSEAQTDHAWVIARMDLHFRLAVIGFLLYIALM
jgi:hypothetical protein